jgi:hypothetical protein
MANRFVNPRAKRGQIGLPSALLGSHKRQPVTELRIPVRMV